MCIDFLPDGRLLVASSANRQLLRREPDGSLVPHADLDPVSMKPWNDIVVNGGGMCLCQQHRFRLRRGQPSAPTIETSPRSIRQR